MATYIDASVVAFLIILHAPLTCDAFMVTQYLIATGRIGNEDGALCVHNL